MTMGRTMALATACLVSLAGCAGPHGPPPVTSLAGASYPLAPCAQGLTVAKVYTITLSDTFELRSPKATKSVSTAKQSGPGAFGEDAEAPKTPYEWRSDAAPKGRLDLNLDLRGRGQAAKIKIVLDDPLLTFRDDDAAIHAGDTLGSKMMCGVERDPNKRYILFTVFYFKPEGSIGPIYGKYNIGLIVKETVQGTGYVLPIYIDPMVKNNG